MKVVSMPTPKRLFDILVSIMFLVVLSPAMLIIAIAIKLTTKGPILYRQERIGLNYSKFTLYKFRSMYNNTEKQGWKLTNMIDGPVFKMRNDPRITPVGRVIRKWSLDEMPQLLNVLKGDMSIVGPRPLMIKETEKILKKFPEYNRRLAMKPGVTSFRLIKGRYNLTFKEWMKLDLEYIDRSSLWLDTKILFKAILVALKGQGW